MNLLFLSTLVDKKTDMTSFFGEELIKMSSLPSPHSPSSSVTFVRTKFPSPTTPSRAANTPRQTFKLVPQPENMSLELFPHQRANIFAMERFEREKKATLPDNQYVDTNIGILGDPPGTGKTHAILGLICRDKMKWKEPWVDKISQVCSNVDGSIRITRKTTLMCLDTTLIVTSLSITDQWVSEIRKTTNLTYKMITRRAEIENLENYDVVVCTVNMYNDLAEKYSDFCFKRFVYDEMDSSYIADMKSINASFLWFVSATFSEVYTTVHHSRRAHFMKQLFSTGGYLYLFQAITVTTNEKLRSLRPMPADYQNVYYDINPVPVVQHLGDQMDQELIEMIDAGNIRDAIRHLGGTEDDSNIADVMRRRAFNKVREAENKIVEYTERPQDDYTRRQQTEWRGRLEEAKRSLANIEDRISAIEINDCVLCSESMTAPTLLGCCQNVACGSCVTTWIRTNRSCPFCRNVQPQLIHLKNHSVPEERKDTQPQRLRGDKFSLLVQIASVGKKVLVFASHGNQFADICNTLKARNISYSLLNGSTSHRKAVIDAYINGTTNVLILNSRENGAGLNLQVTTDIVLWHSMSRALTTQMIGRALRYGITHRLTVHNFFTMPTNGSDVNGE